MKLYMLEMSRASHFSI